MKQIRAIFPVPASLAAVLAGLFASGLAAAVQVEEGVMAAMRDGVKLMADVYRPAEPGVHPVLVLRTPYSRKNRQKEGARYAEAGYIAVIQDMRGRYGSEGDYDSVLTDASRTHDAADGYDTVEWAAKLPGASGKVGTFGLSNEGLAQWRLAALKPPSLVAMAASTVPPRVSALEPGTYRPGARVRYWYASMAPEYRRRMGMPGTHTVKEATELWNRGENHFVWFLPWLELPDALWASPREAETNRAWLRHPAHEPWDSVPLAPEVTVPNLCFVGWYDVSISTIEIRDAMLQHGGSELARRNQRLVIGPWVHAGAHNRKIGALDFGPEAAVAIEEPQIRWFDHWLKGVDNGVEREAPVRIFTMGVNRWRNETEWPPADAVRRDYFLASGGRANTPAGDGRLAAAAPAAGADHYRYDPRNPVPSLWAPNDNRTVPADQRLLQHRQDILVYQTEPLRDPTEVTGYPEVELFAASSAPDTDFFVRLIDVHPDGRAIDVVAGRVRARFAESLARPRLLVPGQTTRFRIRLGPTSMVFLPGHRIRLDVTSSDFPNYDRNHNTAADQNADPVLVPADETIRHGGAEASRLILPEMRRARGADL